MVGWKEGSWLYWIVVGVILAVLIGAYIAMMLYARKRQKAFDVQYNAAKERHEVFVLSKKISKERPQTKWGRFVKVKTYQVVGRVNVSQAIRGMQMSRMQTVSFQTTKSEYEKIQVNHKYKMDIAGNYIGYALAPVPTKDSLKGKGKQQAKVTKLEKRGKKSTPTENGSKRGKRDKA